MLSQTLEVLHRAKALLGEESNWFETAAQWYTKTSLPRRIVVDLLQSNRGKDRLLVYVNDQMLAGVSGVTDLAGRRLTWLLPSNLLRQGNNEVVVHLAKDSPSRLVLQAVSLEQDYHVPWQSLVLSASQPAPTENLALAERKLATSTGRHWTLDPGGYLQFALSLSHSGPVNFTLHLGGGRAGLWLTLLRDVARELKSEIRAALKDKLWQLKEQIARARRNRDPQAQALQDDYDLLSAYQRLHQLQLEPAFEGQPETTLEEIISQTGSPEELIRDLTSATPPENMLQALPAPRPPLPRHPPALPRQPVQSSGGIGSCLFVFFVVGLLILGVGAVIAWQFDPVQDWLKTNLGGETKQAKMGEAAAPAISDLLKSKNAGTGEVQITLFWANKNDLDLHVICPTGEEIYYKDPQKAGGKFDVDMNINYDTASSQAIENVYWPQGKAPKGLYKIYVDHFKNHGKADCQDPTKFTVRLIIRGQTQFFQGEVVHNDPQRKKVLVHQFTLE